VDSGADALRARRNLGAHAEAYRSHAVLPQELGVRLLDHLDGLRITPKRVLVLCDDPQGLQPALSRLFPDASYLHASPSPALLALPAAGSRLQRWFGRTGEIVRLACSAAALPLRNGSVDLVVGHGALAWEDPERVFAEARRVLAPDGLLLFSALGPDTLQQWQAAARAAWPGLDPVGTLVPRLADMHDLADAASQAGLASPVVDMEQLTVHYADLATLLADLRVVGGGNALHARRRGLCTPRQGARLRSALEQQRTAHGLPQTLEAIYGHAWNTRPLVDAAGRPVIPIRAARD